MKIAIGSDNVAFEMKSHIIKLVQDKGFEAVDFGTYTDDVCDYPVYGEKVARAVSGGNADLGILMCGTGVGMSITANRFPGVRVATCSEPYTAVLSRRHNNANILTLGARVIGIELAKMIVDQWLDARFEGGRHQARVDMIEAINNQL